ncbi:hypothetical protein MAR_010816 [Mya arenaria]|uniref:Uncharacterized protein n=1 Tax=Mya arenaria TaxID=6604 RepID=A0ABY7FU22_MYAAR|nr:hypothetical protein MAR_010816 [Mya arenaria]
MKVVPVKSKESGPVPALLRHARQRAPQSRRPPYRIPINRGSPSSSATHVNPAYGTSMNTRNALDYQYSIPPQDIYPPMPPSAPPPYEMSVAPPPYVEHKTGEPPPPPEYNLVAGHISAD